MNMEKLISETDSMEEWEKGYWTAMIPYMTSEQKDRLVTIIETHDAKIKELEVKYGKLETDEYKIDMNTKMEAYLTA